jgi:hypothetical protein
VIGAGLEKVATKNMLQGEASSGFWPGDKINSSGRANGAPGE